LSSSKISISAIHVPSGSLLNIVSFAIKKLKYFIFSSLDNVENIIISVGISCSLSASSWISASSASCSSLSGSSLVSCGSSLVSCGSSLIS